MFQFAGFASPKLCIHFGDTLPQLTQASDRSEAELIGEGGFPHSEIVGSKLAHSSPTLIAACHVLHRLYMPRHPPNALTSRLRVHTTNDNAGRPEGHQLGRAAYRSILVWMKISAFVAAIISSRLTTKTDAATASI